MELVDNEVDAPPNTLDEIICLNAVKDSVAGKPLLQKYDLVSKSPVSGHWRARSKISHYLEAEKAIFRFHNFLGGIGNGITTCSKCNRRHPDGSTATGCKLCCNTDDFTPKNGVSLLPVTALIVTGQRRDQGAFHSGESFDRYGDRCGSSSHSTNIH
jgi:hypothetical protein